jgi:hypothetical protein
MVVTICTDAWACPVAATVTVPDTVQSGMTVPLPVTEQVSVTLPLNWLFELRVRFAVAGDPETTVRVGVLLRIAKSPCALLNTSTGLLEVL